MIQDANRAEDGRVPVGAELYWLERALKLDPDKEYRRVLVRQYLDLTDPKSPKEPDL